MPPEAQENSVIELFAGVGGFRLGLEASGWKTVWSSQWEPATKAQPASSCYVRNFGPSGHSNEDIKVAIDKHMSGEALIPKAELIVGGFPCQDYSVAKSLSTSNGLEGKKGVLWWEILRLVEEISPTYVFLENVDRLLKSPSKQRGRDFAIMLRTLGDLGYLVEWRVVNSAEAGFPQRRIRVFIVATKIEGWPDIELEGNAALRETGVLATVFKSHYPNPVKTGLLDEDAISLTQSFNLGSAKSPFDNAGVFLGDTYWTTKPQLVTSENSASLGDVVIDEKDVPDEFWIESSELHTWEYLKGAKSVERTTSQGHSYRYSEGKMAFPDSLNKPSRTILTGEGGTSASRFKHIIRTPKGYRRLTPLELERLNGFPDDWTKFDSAGERISDVKRAFFMGNALVVGLIEMVGAELSKRSYARRSINP